MPHDWSLEIVTSFINSRKALRLIVRLPAIFNHNVRFLNRFEHLTATDFDREIIRVRYDKSYDVSAIVQLDNT